MSSWPVFSYLTSMPTWSYLDPVTPRISLSCIVLPVNIKISPVYAFSISSELEMRQTFQKLTGACCITSSLRCISDAAYTSALLICMFINVIHVAREPFEIVLNMNSLILSPFIFTDNWKVDSSITFTFTLIFVKSTTPLSDVSDLSA